MAFAPYIPIGVLLVFFTLEYFLDIPVGHSFAEEPSTRNQTLRPFIIFIIPYLKSILS